MTAPLTPDQAKSWFSMLYSVAEKSTPVTLVFMLVTGGLFAWHMLKQLDHCRHNNILVYQEILRAKEAQLTQASEFNNKLAELYSKCNPRPP